MTTPRNWGPGHPSYSREREVVGYVWRSPSGVCTQYWYANDPDDEEPIGIEQCRAEAHEARENCGGTIRKLTRPVKGATK